MHGCVAPATTHTNRPQASAVGDTDDIRDSDIGDDLPAYATYTLCEHCQSVFGEFLQNLDTQSEKG